ncbi:hypothetical protein D3C71_2227260 [compost metagenome]
MRFCRLFEMDGMASRISLMLVRAITSDKSAVPYTFMPEMVMPFSSLLSSMKATGR